MKKTGTNYGDQQTIHFCPSLVILDAKNLSKTNRDENLSYALPFSGHFATQTLFTAQTLNPNNLGSIQHFTAAFLSSVSGENDSP